MLVDYDAFSNSSSIQTVKFQRSAQKNVQRFAFIGVQNRATARAPFRGDISVQIFRRKQAFVEVSEKHLLLLVALKTTFLYLDWSFAILLHLFL